MVNIPAAQVEAVENGAVVSRHTAVVGKVDRPSPIVNQQDHRDQLQSLLDGAGEHHQEGPDPEDAEGSELPHRLPASASTTSRAPSCSPSRSTGTRDEATNYMFRQDPGDDQLARASSRSTSPARTASTCTTRPHKGLFGNDYRFESSGCVRVQNMRELITWMLRDTPGWSRDADRRDVPQRRAHRRQGGEAGAALLGLHHRLGDADGVVHFRNDIYGLDGLEQYAGRRPARAALELPLRSNRRPRGRVPWRALGAFRVNGGMPVRVFRPTPARGSPSARSR